jgi:uroporphyrinogen-III decarboxylase
MSSEMTSRQRLQCALDCQQPDRVPIWMLYPRECLPYYVDVHHLPEYAGVMPAIWSKTDWLDRRGIDHPPFYTAAARVETHQETSGNWTITRTIVHTPLGDLTGEERQDAIDAGETTTEFLCKDLSDLEKILSIPLEPFEPDLDSFRKAAGRLGEAGLMMVDCGMPLGVPYNLLGPENFAIYSLTERTVLVRFVQAMFERIYIFLQKALAAGAGPVFFTVETEFVGPPMGSLSTFDALVTPFQGPLFELIHHSGGKVIVHHHGRIKPLLQRLANLGADAIHPIEEPPIGDCPLAEAKRQVGDRVCLIGSVQYDDFERLEPDEIESLVRRQITDAAPGGGMILSPTAGPYEAHISPHRQENIRRFIEAGLKWGRYPVNS